MENIFFEDQTFEFETIRSLGYGDYGGAEISEVRKIVNDIQPGDFESWYTEWNSMATKIEKLASESAENNRTVSANKAFLRACNYYRTAEFFLDHVDKRRNECYLKSVKSFKQALKNSSLNIMNVHIPYEDYTMDGYLYIKSKNAPTLIYIGGYDSTAEELYFSGGASAIERGYNLLIFDGPGQGGTLRLKNKVSIPDYEKPVSAAIDYLETAVGIDTVNSFIALMGMSLGGYYANRAVAFESRIDACILFDVFTNVWESTKERSPYLTELSKLSDEELNDKLEQVGTGAQWMVNNGLWVFGQSSLADMIEYVKKFNALPVSKRIICPMLLLFGTNDQFVNEKQLSDLENELTCNYTSHVFDETFGAEYHCQVGNVGYMTQVVFDWLDEQKE